MGYHMGLQHITVLHIDRLGGIWLYPWAGSGVITVVRDGLNDTSTCTLGLMLCV